MTKTYEVIGAAGAECRNSSYNRFASDINVARKVSTI